jgi:hypothetical protein
MLTVSVNYVAVLTATVVAWAFGAVWYYFFAARWGDALGKTKEQLMPAGFQPVGTMVVSFMSEFVMAVVLAHFIASMGSVSVLAGLLTAAACWIGFVLTTIIVNDRYSRNSLALISVSSWHWLGVLLVMGAVIGAFG